MLKQPYKDVKIIIVSDGDSDRSAEELKPYCDRIRVILKENVGVSSVRNRGIHGATGEYLMFADDLC